jgi:hypothetical protein
MTSPYHYIGLDVHKLTVAFCDKRADGKTIDSGSFTTRRGAIARWAAERRQPWIGAMEATLFSGRHQPIPSTGPSTSPQSLPK